MFIKEESDEHKDAKEGNPATSDKQVNMDFFIFLFN
jgi:hypothetical protein